MKTITFYSYKGGVGRSLALSNIAMRLSEFNKKVCVIDFDIEAPGIHFKFKNFSKPIIIKEGLVDYIYKFSCEGNIPRDILNYRTIINPKNKTFTPIDLISAGNIDGTDYWRKLSSINWSELFYSESGKGVNFFLDLKAKIQNELKPDFLLIDSRTGITDISGITLKLLADEVVILAANNEENIFGSKKIIKNLLDPTSSFFGNPPKVNFLLTRLPFTGEPEDINKEHSIIEKKRNEFKKYLNISEFNITVIHSDRRLEEDERLLIGDEYENKSVSISNDYLKLFQMLTSDVLTSQEIDEFQNKKISEREYIKATREKDNFIRIQHLDIAIELNPNKFEYFFERGLAYRKQNNWEKAIADTSKAIELNPDNSTLNNYMGMYLMETKQYDKALEFIEKSLRADTSNIYTYFIKNMILVKQNKFSDAINLLTYVLDNIDSSNDLILNARANLNRILGDYKKAYADIYKAIEINSEQAIYFGTLAEIYASEDKMEEFYLNLSIALAKGIKVSELKSTLDVYEKVKSNERFLGLMSKYDIDVEEIFLNEK